MKKINLAQKVYFSLFILFMIPGCAILSPSDHDISRAIYLHTAYGKDLIEQYAPVFIIEEPDKDFNRIGFPAFKKDSSGDYKARIDTSRPAYFTLKQDFTVSDRHFTNLIYRIHFPETPLPLLTSGKNVGLIVYITLNDLSEPLLVTTLHTCGCYLAITPTDNYDPEKVPKGWDFNEVKVYGEILPGLLKTSARKNPPEKLVITLRSKTHRVKEISFSVPDINQEIPVLESSLEPMELLDRLPAGDTTLSFFETEGLRKGYVRGSYKHLEMLLMSWWAMDLYVGADKALGPREKTGNNFYTSLKFWARQKSDIWNFPRFLEYWDWNL